MRVEKVISTEPHQAETLMKHKEWLLRLGDGKLPTILDNIIEIPKQMVCDSPEELENKLFDDFERNMINQEYLLQILMISSTNITINERNY